MNRYENNAINENPFLDDQRRWGLSDGEREETSISFKSQSREKNAPKSENQRFFDPAAAKWGEIRGRTDVEAVRLARR